LWVGGHPVGLLGLPSLFAEDARARRLRGGSVEDPQELAQVFPRVFHLRHGICVNFLPEI